MSPGAAHTLAVTVLGHDRPGIIADVTDVLAGLGGNLEDSSMTLLRGHFAMTLVLSGDSDADTTQRALSEALEGSGLVVSVLAVADEGPTALSGPAYLLSVHGADRAGIVSAVAGLVASYGGNVTDLTTRLAGALYVLVAEVELPGGADVEALTTRLGELADELGVDATLRPVDSDLL